MANIDPYIRKRKEYKHHLQKAKLYFLTFEKLESYVTSKLVFSVRSICSSLIENIEKIRH